MVLRIRIEEIRVLNGHKYLQRRRERLGHSGRFGQLSLSDRDAEVFSGDGSVQVSTVLRLVFCAGRHAFDVALGA